MKASNRMKIQCCKGQGLYQTLAEIIRSGDTFDELDMYIIQKQIMKYKFYDKESSEEYQKEILDMCENKIDEAIKSMFGFKR